jgi:hypothetical protein
VILSWAFVTGGWLWFCGLLAAMLAVVVRASVLATAAMRRSLRVVRQDT